ncbi:MAG: hypothetical protein ACP5OZ_03815 [Candidatus Woesearchaeota archaeon]
MKRNKQEWEFETKRTNVLKDFAIFLITIIKSLNPDSYQRFESRKLSECYLYLLKLVIFCVLVSFVFLIPQAFSRMSEIQNTLSKIEALKFNPEITTNETIDFGLGIVINRNAKNITNENILITSEKVFKKPFFCFFSSELCALFEKKTKEYTVEEFFDIKNRSSEIIKMAKIVFIVFLPAILIIITAYYFLRYLIITFAIAFIAYLPLLIKKKVELSRIMKISIHASTIMVLLEIIGRYYYANNIFLKLIPFGIYILLFSIGLILTLWKIDF